jgi:hypothetical protein
VGDERRNLGGTQKAMPVYLPENFKISVGDANGRDFLRALEAWAPSLSHADILANFFLPNP